MQNSVSVFRDGEPVRMLVRDLGAVRIVPERLEQQGFSLPLVARLGDPRRRPRRPPEQGLLLLLPEPPGGIDRGDRPLPRRRGAAAVGRGRRRRPPSLRELKADTTLAEQARGRRGGAVSPHAGPEGAGDHAAKGRRDRLHFRERPNPLAGCDAGRERTAGRCDDDAIGRNTWRSGGGHPVDSPSDRRPRPAGISPVVARRPALRSPTGACRPRPATRSERWAFRSRDFRLLHDRQPDLLGRRLDGPGRAELGGAGPDRLGGPARPDQRLPAGSGVRAERTRGSAGRPARPAPAADLAPGWHDGADLPRRGPGHGCGPRSRSSRWSVTARASLAAMVLPIRNALLPALVPREALASAVASQTAVMNLSRIIGPAIAGGLLLVMPIEAVFWINGASFVGGALDACWRCGPARPRRRRAIAPVPGLREAIAYVRGDGAVAVAPDPGRGADGLRLPLHVADAAVRARFPAPRSRGVRGVSCRSRPSGRSPARAGWRCRGTVCPGRPGSGRVDARVRAEPAAVHGLASFAVGIVAMFLVGLTSQVYRTTSRITLQEHVPDHLRGRILSIALMDRALIPVGAILFGSVAELAGAGGPAS